MTVKRSILAAALALAGIAALPSAAWAQSVITGIVRDTSGAVMPGVTVEAASPVLIEGVRTAVTDSNGSYRIVDLRPGIYTLKYELTGFNTQVRDGFELAANFTATVNIDLTVGTLQESVTVSGASPVVDVQSNAKQQVLTRDVLSAVPTAGTIQGLGQLVVGVTLNVPDVGGSRAMQQTYFAVRGQGGAQTVVLVDGMMTNGLMGDGAVQGYHNESMTQEAVYQTAGGNAETLTGGVNMNLIPKDGGNQFRGGFKAFKSPSSWQGDNLTDELRALGVTGVDKIANFYEWNIEQGGPIVKNKLWFFGAFRKARYDRPIANTFAIPAGTPNIPAAFAACRANPDSCEQGVSDEKMDNPILRLTWQVSERNKIAVYNDRALRLRGHAMGALTDQTTASVIWNTPTFSTGSIKWTSTLSSKMLLEVGFSGNRERYDNLYQPGILAERNTDAWYRNVRKNDVSTGQLWNASSAQLGNYPDRYNLQGALSYVTGTHTIKVGGAWQFGKYIRYNNANADLYQSYSNGRPFQVTVLNTPLRVGEDLDANFGVYAQDTWSLNRLTLNLGLRFDLNKQVIRGQDAQIGRFANIAAYDGFQAVPTWKDFSPRLSAVYDLSGDGKTAVRVGFNKFVTAQTTGFSQLYNPTALTSQNLPWTDVNGDDIAQGERGCTYLTAGCEINFANLATNFGRRSLATPDPDLKRPYSLPLNVGVTHELFSGFSLAAEYLPHQLQEHHDAPELAARPGQLQPVQRGEPARRQRDPRVGHQADVPRTGGERRQHELGDEADLQRLRPELQCPPAAWCPCVRRLQYRAHHQQHVRGGRERPESLALLRSGRQRHPVAAAVQGHPAVSAPLLGHLGQRGLAEPQWLPDWRRRPGLRRVHAPAPASTARADRARSGRSRRRPGMAPTALAPARRERWCCRPWRRAASPA